MVTVRGVNLFPSSIESFVRQVAGIGEFCVQVTRPSQLDHLAITVEGSSEAAQQLQKLLDQKLGLKTDVQCVQTGMLPRSDGKSRRWQDLRGA
jgi:phenylacetate-CoA ligase